ncbi:MAG: FAD-dependent oxidoreductase [Solirubrobacterales bacterium]|nr:FAD-dependent oxidoreductase [Solirubrobacterales bacterium]
MAPEFEIAVVGAGIVGLATAHALQDNGEAVCVYERGVPGNAQSGGESRIFRHIHADPRLIALARRARDVWREWESRFGCELLSHDGVVAIGAAVEPRLALLEADGEVVARRLDPDELAARLPVLSRWEGPAMLDEAGGAIRTRAAIGALSRALSGRLLFDEVLSVRTTPAGTVEVRSAAGTREFARVLVCAGRGTAALARGAGLSLPLRHAAHVRLTYPVRAAPAARLACLLDSSGEFGEVGAYADPLPGNAAYAVGVGEVTAGEDGSVADADGLHAVAERTTAYVRRALPGLEPNPSEARHCWVTELPWSPDGFALWRRDAVLVFAGNHLFKHAPALGRMLAAAAREDDVPASLRPEAQLGAPGRGWLYAPTAAASGSSPREVT